MLRYHHFTDRAGRGPAITERRRTTAGSSTTCSQYSPLHNLHPRTETYPATLITGGGPATTAWSPPTVTSSPRPCRRRKVGSAPILLRVDQPRRATVTSCRPTQRLINEATSDRWSFLHEALGHLWCQGIHHCEDSLVPLIVALCHRSRAPVVDAIGVGRARCMTWPSDVRDCRDQPARPSTTGLRTTRIGSRRDPPSAVRRAASSRPSSSLERHLGGDPLEPGAPHMSRPRCGAGVAAGYGLRRDPDTLTDSLERLRGS